MTKFNVGDKVRIINTDYHGAGLEVGSVHEVVCADKYGVYLTARYDDGYTNDLYFRNQEVVPSFENPSDTIVVGGKYTSKNGNKWECIAVGGDNAWLAGAGDGGPYGEAYQFKTDGKNISQGGGNWDIAFPPHEEWIDTRFSVGVSNHSAPDGTNNHTARIRFKLVYGKPDWSTATVAE